MCQNACKLNKLWVLLVPRQSSLTSYISCWWSYRASDFGWHLRHCRRCCELPLDVFLASLEFLQEIFAALQRWRLSSSQGRSKCVCFWACTHGCGCYYRPRHSGNRRGSRVWAVATTFITLLHSYRACNLWSFACDKMPLQVLSQTDRSHKQAQ